jgi:thioredoxin-like negative regulator of GroEL
MSRSESLRKSALRWKLIGGIAFLIGAFMLYQKVYYETRDFYGENFEMYQGQMSEVSLSENDNILLDSALTQMQEENYWDAATLLEKLKQQNPKATQISDWYKILCMVGLEEKEEAISLLDYYLEQPDFDFNRERAELLLKEY